MNKLSSDVVCPFCGEGDFDLMGLKMHFNREWCEPYNETPSGGLGTVRSNKDKDHG